MKTERFFDGALVEPVTRQGIFETIVRHYRKQPRRCPPEGQCAYELPDGDKCWIRSLIGGYHPTMNGLPVRDLARRFRQPAWFHSNITFIEKLQNIHDNELNWEPGVMPKVLGRFAAEHGLTMPL